MHFARFSGELEFVFKDCCSRWGDGLSRGWTVRHPRKRDTKNAQETESRPSPVVVFREGWSHSEGHGVPGFKDL